MSAKSVKFGEHAHDVSCLADCHKLLWKGGHDEVAISKIAERVLEESKEDELIPQLKEALRPLRVQFSPHELQEFVDRHWKVIPELIDFCRTMRSLIESPTPQKLQDAITQLHTPCVRIANTTGPSLYNIAVIRDMARDMIWDTIQSSEGMAYNYNNRIIPSFVAATGFSIPEAREYLRNTLEFIPFFANCAMQLDKIRAHSVDFAVDIRDVLNSRYSSRKLYSYGTRHPALNQFLIRCVGNKLKKCINGSQVRGFKLYLEKIFPKDAPAKSPIEEAIQRIVHDLPLEKCDIRVNTLVETIYHYLYLYNLEDKLVPANDLHYIFIVVSESTESSPALDQLLSLPFEGDNEYFLNFLSLFSHASFDPTTFVDDFVSKLTEAGALTEKAAAIAASIREKPHTTLETVKLVADLKQEILPAIGDTGRPELRKLYYQKTLPLSGSTRNRSLTIRAFKHFMECMKDINNLDKLANFTKHIDHDTSLFLPHLSILLSTYTDKSRFVLENQKSLSILLASFDYTHPVLHKQVARILSRFSYTELAPIYLQLMPVDPDAFITDPVQSLFGKRMEIPKKKRDLLEELRGAIRDHSPSVREGMLISQLGTFFVRLPQPVAEELLSNLMLKKEGKPLQPSFSESFQKAITLLREDTSDPIKATKDIIQFIRSYIDTTESSFEACDKFLVLTVLSQLPKAVSESPLEDALSIIFQTPLDIFGRETVTEEEIKALEDTLRDCNEFADIYTHCRGTAVFTSYLSQRIIEGSKIARDLRQFI